MSLCPDCYKEGRLEIMIHIHDEVFKGRDWAVLECIGCGSSVRCEKEDLGKELLTNV